MEKRKIKGLQVDQKFCGFLLTVPSPRNPCYKNQREMPNGTVFSSLDGIFNVDSPKLPWLHNQGRILRLGWKSWWQHQVKYVKLTHSQRRLMV